MFIPYLKYCCSIIVILFIANTAYAEVYKWVDNAGQTHYSQLPPTQYEADIIKTRPGPKVEPAQSQQAVDTMIEQQATDAALREENKIKKTQQAEQRETKSKNCEIAKSNLTKYQNKPNGRTRNAAGEYIRIDENDRQQKIKQLKQDIQKYC
tara:strand:- start:1267 stop:1722 length:456 start_codon:yes stop_codon:yes gene_type:complete